MLRAKRAYGADESERGRTRSERSSGETGRG
jgi:hypothetical protein